MLYCIIRSYHRTSFTVALQAVVIISIIMYTISYSTIAAYFVQVPGTVLLDSTLL